ncbi:MAG: TolC family outer membrane protein [Magnetococcales bacterium]|nr:TolC family outer membrane protein [Magnetococcales bacterium]
MTMKRAFPSRMGGRSLLALLSGWCAMAVFCQSAALQASNRPFWTAVDTAISRNPTIHRALADLKSARESKPLALSKMLPTVNVQASKDLDQGTHYKNLGTKAESDPTRVELQVNQSLINVSNWKGHTQSEHHILASEADVETARQNLVLQVATAAGNWLQSREVLALGENYQKITERHVQVAKLRFKAGESTATDVEEASSRNAQAKATIAVARNTLDQTTATYRELVGEDPTPDLKLPELVWDKTVVFEEKLPEWIEERPEIRAAQERIIESREGVGVQRAAHLPSMRLAYTAGRTWDSELGGTSGNSLKDTVDNHSVMLMLDVPLYAGGATVSRTRQAEAGWELSLANLDSLRNQAMREARQAKAEMETTETGVAALEMALESSGKALSGMEEEFLVGTRTLLDLLDAQNEVLTIQTNLVRQRYQNQVARVRLWNALGWPLTPDRLDKGPRDKPPEARAEEYARSHDQPYTVGVNLQAPRIEEMRTPVPGDERLPPPPKASQPVEGATTPVLPVVEQGPYLVRAGTYVDTETLMRVERQLADRGIVTRRQPFKNREGLPMTRLVVGPFADFDATIKARDYIRFQTGLATGWLRNPQWTGPTEALPEQVASQGEEDSLVPSLEKLGGGRNAGEEGGDGFSTSAAVSRLMERGLATNGEAPNVAPPPAETEIVAAKGPPEGFPPVQDGAYLVQVGSFQTATEMRTALLTLKGEGFPVRIEEIRAPDGNNMRRLVIGPFARLGQALQAKNMVTRASGITAGWIPNPNWRGCDGMRGTTFWNCFSLTSDAAPK